MDHAARHGWPKTRRSIGKRRTACSVVEVAGSNPGPQARNRRDFRETAMRTVGVPDRDGASLDTITGEYTRPASAAIGLFRLAGALVRPARHRLESLERPRQRVPRQFGCGPWRGSLRAGAYGYQRRRSGSKECPAVLFRHGSPSNAPAQGELPGHSRPGMTAPLKAYRFGALCTCLSAHASMRSAISRFFESSIIMWVTPGIPISSSFM